MGFGRHRGLHNDLYLDPRFLRFLTRGYAPYPDVRDVKDGYTLSAALQNVRRGRRGQGTGGAMRFGAFLGIAILLFVLWIGGFVVFHVAGFLIHLLLIFAVIALLIHLFSGSKSA